MGQVKLSPIRAADPPVTAEVGVWCTNRDDEFEMHSEDEPYCSRIVTKLSVIPEGDVVKCQAWINATSPFTHGEFTQAELEELERLYDGVEIAIETWRGTGKTWEEQKIRIRRTPPELWRPRSSALLTSNKV